MGARPFGAELRNRRRRIGRPVLPTLCLDQSSHRVLDRRRRSDLVRGGGVGLRRGAIVCAGLGCAAGGGAGLREVRPRGAAVAAAPTNTASFRASSMGPTGLSALRSALASGFQFTLENPVACRPVVPHAWHTDGGRTGAALRKMSLMRRYMPRRPALRLAAQVGQGLTAICMAGEGRGAGFMRGICLGRSSGACLVGSACMSNEFCGSSKTCLSNGFDGP